MPTLHDLWYGNQKLRFLIVGGWNTAFGYLVFVALYWLLLAWLHYLVIAAAAHFIAVTQSFVSQRCVVFRASGLWLRQYWRFHVASLVALGINLAALGLLVEILRAHVLVAQAVATAVSVVTAYLLHRHYSFGGA